MTGIEHSGDSQQRDNDEDITRARKRTENNNKRRENGSGETAPHETARGHRVELQEPAARIENGGEIACSAV